MTCSHNQCPLKLFSEQELNFDRLIGKLEISLMVIHTPTATLILNKGDICIQNAHHLISQQVTGKCNKTRFSFFISLTDIFNRWGPNQYSENCYTWTFLCCTSVKETKDHNFTKKNNQITMSLQHAIEPLKTTVLWKFGWDPLNNTGRVAHRRVSLCI